MSAMRGNASVLPSATVIASRLRHGVRLVEIAREYGVDRKTVARRVRAAGFDPATGANRAAEETDHAGLRRSAGSGPYVSAAYGAQAAIAVPTTPVAHRRRDRSREGLDWQAINAAYEQRCAAEGQPVVHAPWSRLAKLALTPDINSPRVRQSTMTYAVADAPSDEFRPLDDYGDVKRAFQ